MTISEILWRFISSLAALVSLYLYRRYGFGPRAIQLKISTIFYDYLSPFSLLLCLWLAYEKKQRFFYRNIKSDGIR